MLNESEVAVVGWDVAIGYVLKSQLGVPGSSCSTNTDDIPAVRARRGPKVPPSVLFMSCARCHAGLCRRPKVGAELPPPPATRTHTHTHCFCGA